LVRPIIVGDKTKGVHWILTSLKVLFIRQQALKRILVWFGGLTFQISLSNVGCLQNTFHKERLTLHIIVALIGSRHACNYVKMSLLNFLTKTVLQPDRFERSEKDNKGCILELFHLFLNGCLLRLTIRSLGFFYGKTITT